MQNLSLNPILEGLTPIFKTYKQQSDQVIISRLYQGKESVGYTFNQAHLFHDFKKAMMI